MLLRPGFKMTAVVHTPWVRTVGMVWAITPLEK